MPYSREQGSQPYKKPEEGEEEQTPDWDQTEDGGAEAGQWSWDQN